MKLDKIKDTLMNIKTSKFVKIDNKNYDFIYSICSESNYNFHELYYVHANQYCTCLQIFDFMIESYENFLDRYINDDNIIVTIDIVKLSDVKYENKIDKTLKDKSDETEGIKKVRLFKKNVEQIQQLNAFDDYVSQEKLSVMTMTVRLYVFEKTKEDLQNKINEIVAKFRRQKMRGYIQTNDLESDVQALTKIDNNVEKMVSSPTIVDMLLFNELNVVENNMPLLGYTNNGLYAPDIFSFKNTSFNALAIGKMGSGKSAIFKIINEGCHLMGNHTSHFFDYDGEYVDYCKKLNIPIVGLSGGNNINICQIFYTINVNGVIKKEDISSKISVIEESFKNATDNDNDDVKKQLSLVLQKMYSKCVGKKLDSFSDDNWFTLSDVRKYVIEKQENGEFPDEAKQDIYKLLLGLDYMIEKYGYIYDKKTNMHFDLTKSLCFDVSFLKELNDNNIKSAYITLLMTYIGQAVRYNHVLNKELMKKKGVKDYELKRPLHTYFLMVDETMQYIESGNFLVSVNALLKYMRKAYCGAGFVMHTLEDVSSKQDMKDRVKDDKLAQMFKLCTNKFFGASDGESLETMSNLCRGMTMRDIDIISNFKKGAHGERKFLVYDDQKRKIIFTSIVNPYQRDYFGGGV